MKPIRITVTSSEVNARYSLDRVIWRIRLTRAFGIDGVFEGPMIAYYHGITHFNYCTLYKLKHVHFYNEWR